MQTRKVKLFYFFSALISVAGRFGITKKTKCSLPLRAFAGNIFVSRKGAKRQRAQKEERKMKLEDNLDRIHAATVKNRWLQIFTAFNRGLLAFGFIPPGIKKILRQPFTILPDSNPVGHYFNALYQTGFYYEFIGWAQVIAAILLLFPRTAHLGALMFFPIILNIAVLTNAVGFAGTWLVTILMFLSSLYLVCWDYDRIKAIFFIERRNKVSVFSREFLWLPALFAVGGAIAGGFAKLISLGNFKNYLTITLLLIAAGLIFGVFVHIHHRFMHTGDLNKEIID